MSNALKDSMGIDYTISTYEEHALQKGSNSQACAYVAIAGDDDEHFGGVDVWSYFRIQNMEKILCRHVGRLYGRHTIAATMEAMNITS